MESCTKRFFQKTKPPSSSILRAAKMSPRLSCTITGIVLFPLITFSTKFRSVFSSARVSERIASAQTSMRDCSSRVKSRTSKLLTSNDTEAMRTAATTRATLTWLIDKLFSTGIFNGFVDIFYIVQKFFAPQSTFTTRDKMRRQFLPLLT